MIEYNHQNIPFAKELRKNMTPWERKLWYEFLRSYPVRFQRQKAIGQYIVDFYAAKARLAVELDGSQHYDEKEVKRDTRRTEYLNEFGVKVIRIPNNEVMSNFTGVCEYIDREVKEQITKKALSDE